MLVLPFWLATLAAAICALFTRYKRVASWLVIILCALAVSNLGGCLLTVLRINRAVG